MKTKTKPQSNIPAALERFGRELIDAIELLRSSAENTVLSILLQDSPTRKKAQIQEETLQLVKEVIMLKMQNRTENKDKVYNEMLDFAKKKGYESVADAMGAMGRLAFENEYKTFKNYE